MMFDPRDVAHQTALVVGMVAHLATFFIPDRIPPLYTWGREISSDDGARETVDTEAEGDHEHISGAQTLPDIYKGVFEVGNEVIGRYRKHVELHDQIQRK